MVRIKICGITNKVDAVNAARLDVDMLGFVFYPKSKRYVTARIVREICDELPPPIRRVGVFVDEEKGKALETATEARIDTVQFHGDETPEYCASFRDSFKVIKAFRIGSKSDLAKVNAYDVDYILLDARSDIAPGGTGIAFDWTIIKDFEFLRPVILSGGLRPDTVGRAITEISPYGVDVSSGVERSPGRKDLALMTKFVEEARKA